MGMWDLILGGGGLVMGGIGAIQEAEQGRQDREYWKGQTRDAGQRIDEFRDQGQVDLQNLSDILRPGYDRMAGDWSRGSTDLTNKGMAGWDSLVGGLNSSYGSGASGIQGLSGDRMGALGSGLSGLQSTMGKAYGDRTNQGMSMLLGYGNQAKAGLRKDWADATKSELARQGSIGLGNTSAGAVTRRGMASGQADAMGDLEERFAKIGLDTYSGLSADQLSSQSGLGQFGIGMMDAARGQDLSQRERLLNAGTELAGSYGAQSLNAKRDLGENNLANQVAASKSYLGEQERLAMQPFDFMKEMMNTKNSTMLDWGLPPEVTPAALTIGQQMTNAWNVLKTPKQDDSGGGFSTPFFGMNW